MPSKHLSYHRLLEQLRLPGCAICCLGAQASARTLDGIAGEHLTDPQVRIGLRASLGFCAAHAHRLDAMPRRLAVAVLYDDFLRQIDGELEGWAGPRRRREIRAPCPACASVEREERDHLRVLADSIRDPQIAAAYEASSGLCLDHTLRLCRLLEESARRWVLSLERARIARLRSELAEVIRKHDYRYRDEPWGEEKTAPSRAVAKVAGESEAVEPGLKPG